MENFNCPVCKNTDTRIVLNSNKFKIIACDFCQNAWTYPAPKNVDYVKNDFHSQFTYKTINDLPLQWKLAVKNQINLLKKYVPKKGKILEIGCGEGLLLKALNQEGFNTLGIEPSYNACKIAQKRGLKVINSVFKKELIKDEFAAVVMTHTLEHFENPLQTLKDIKTFIPNGVLLLVQTNYLGLMPSILKDKWYAWVPTEHYWHFTPLGLKFIAKKTGYKIAEIQYSSIVHNYNPLSFIYLIKPELGDQFHIVLK